MTSSQYQLSRRDFGLFAGGFAILCTTAGADAILNRGLSDPQAVAAAAKKLENLPTTIGDWTSASVAIDIREQRLAEIDGYVRRQYRHTETGRTVELTILCGASGPMSVHPPTACFEGVGYSLVAGPSVVGITDNSERTVSLNKATFRPRDTFTSEVVRVFWGWSVDGQWDAPANPRLAWRGNPVLYKIYTVDRAWETADDFAQSEAFLQDALPVIRQALAVR